MNNIFRHPSKETKKILQRDKAVISQSYGREFDFIYSKAKGCYIYDIDGNKYLDFAAGISVMNIGHTQDQVVKAIIKQAKKGFHAAFGDFYAELPVQFTETLLSFLPKQFNNAFLSNSGTESVEAAIKLARWNKRKKWLISFEHCFHGRTMGSLSMTKSKKVQREGFKPFLPVKHVPYANPYRMGDDCSNYCLNKLEKTIKSVKENVSAIFIEPIQGEGGYVVPPKDFIKGVRNICNRYNIFLADDEVQTGGFRTGKFLAIENFGVWPDIISMSKSIGGGIPLGATVANKSLMKWPSGSHSSTFGGNLLACAAGLETLNFMKRERLGEKAKHVGRYIIGRLEEMKDRYEIIGDVRGIGLMIGLELVKSKKSKTPAVNERKKIIEKSISKGLILLPAGVSTIRICPPLIITEEQADKGLDILESSIKEVRK
jgi:4-aminobutyrate aminotransferase